MSKPLGGKTAFVTGGSRGLGAAIVKRLAADGASVAFSYMASGDRAQAIEDEIAANGGMAHAIQADSADEAALRAAIEQAAARLGRIDILVNNAGIYIPGLVEDYDLKDFDRMVAVNIRAIFVGVQAALPHMGTGGRIITMGSVTADRIGSLGGSVYSMTKGAVATLTRGFARDLGARGITVNTVEPGPTETDMNDFPATRELMPKLMALGRMGKDVEVASFVAYLASPESSFITGSALTIDGGYLA